MADLPDLPPLPPPPAPRLIPPGEPGSTYHIVCLRKLHEEVVKLVAAQKQLLNLNLSLERSLDSLVFIQHGQTALLEALLDEMKSQRSGVRGAPSPPTPPPPFQANDDDDDDENVNDDEDDDDDDDNDRRPPGVRYAGLKIGKAAPSPDANKENAPPARASRSGSSRSQAASSSSSSSASASSSKKRSSPDTPFGDESARAHLRRFPTEDSDETKEYSEFDDIDDDDDDGEGGGFESQGSSAASSFSSRRTKVMWTKEEERALRNGVASEGYGKWEKILDWDACNKKPVLQRKTAVQLKDKARSLGLE
jgi:hypothetical protein